jgi:hypothetical protein
MSKRNLFAVVSFSSLAVASVLQADEPIKVQPQQQPTPQVQSISPSNTVWVIPNRRERRRHQQQYVYTSPPVAIEQQQKPASTSSPPQPSVTSAPTASTQPAPVIISQPIQETRKPGPLSRLLGRRYSSSYVSSPQPAPISQPQPSGQQLPAPGK